MRSGRRAVGGWCALPSSFSAELVAGVGVDYVVIDMHQGLSAYSDIVPMLQAIAGTPATPLLRVPHGDLATAQRALDAGAEGLIFPLVNNAGDAAASVAACRYPPEGSRSFGPIRSQGHLGADTAHANREVLCLVQIETAEAIRNLEQIVGHPGVDGVYAGPADLALSHGLELGAESDEMEALFEAIVATCRDTGRIPAVHAVSGRGARRAFDRGFTMVSVGDDATWLRAGYAREIAASREAPQGDGPE